MSTNLPHPEDYAEGFSPLQNAELVIWIVDERPKSKPSLRGVGRKIRNFARKMLMGEHDVNDMEAEQAWQIINQKWGAITPETITHFLTEKYAQSDHLRKFEYAFLAKCLTRSDVQKDIIVDLGGGNSYSTVVPMLFRFPNTQILSVDVIKHASLSKYNVQYIQGDCIHANLPDQSANIITIVSTLEHVGLGRWGDPLDVDGDIKAMQEAWRILKPGGYVVLTIPYGFPTVVYNLHRVYDAGRVARLTEGFEVIQAEYSLLGRSATQVEIEGVKLVASVPGFHTTVPPQNGAIVPEIPGGAMFLLKKTTSIKLSLP